jgi:prevent-host-death family protein
MDVANLRSEQSNIGVPGARWSLQDAKARFSEVVRLAREDGPQRVTLHGEDAVVIVSAQTYDRDRQRHTGKRLVEALAASPLGDLEFERAAVSGPVRDVDL